MSGPLLEPDEEQRAQRARLDGLYADIFEANGAGVEIYDDLVRRFGRELAVTAGGVDAVLQTYRNLGRREVLDYIVTSINRGRGHE